MLAIVSNAALNTGVQICLQHADLICFEHIPRNKIAGSSSFNFLRNLCTVRCNSYANLHSHQQCRRSLCFHILSHTCFYLFDKSHSNNCEVIPQRGFNLHFPEDEQFFGHVPIVISMVSFEKYLFRFFVFLNVAGELDPMPDACMLHKSCTPELYPNPCPFLFVLFSCY